MEGTRHLVEAAQIHSVKRMIAQSIAWAYEPGIIPPPRTSSDVQAPAPRKSTIDGIISLEHDVAQLPNHVILRYGMFYGPGTWYDANGVMAERYELELFQQRMALCHFSMSRMRRMPYCRHGLADGSGQYRR